jgi:Antirestriction protein
MPKPKEAKTSREITTERIPRGQWRKYISKLVPNMHFPPLDVAVANMLDQLMAEPRHLGGFYALKLTSNGSLYIYPDLKASEPKINLQSPNGSRRSVSPEAAGIVASLFVFSYSTAIPGGDGAADAYHRLRYYAYSHPEAAEIVALID